MTVNHDVVGSSPTGGAKQGTSLRRGSLFVSSPPVGIGPRHHDLKTPGLSPLFAAAKAFSKRRLDARRSVLYTLFARASGANHPDVVGSSPTGGARKKALANASAFFQ